MCLPQTQGPRCEEKKGDIILWISVMVNEEKEGKPTEFFFLGWILSYCVNISGSSPASSGTPAVRL